MSICKKVSTFLILGILTTQLLSCQNSNSKDHQIKELSDSLQLQHGYVVHGTYPNHDISYIMNNDSKLERIGEREFAITGEVLLMTDTLDAMDKPPIELKIGNIKVILRKGSLNIRHFEDYKRITLIDGQATVIAPCKTVTIKSPGQTIDAFGDCYQLWRSTPEIQTAWANGNFSAEDGDLYYLFIQLGLWYGVKINYIDGHKFAKMKFEGQFPHKTALESILKVLEVNGIPTKYDKANRTLTIIGSETM